MTLLLYYAHGHGYRRKLILKKKKDTTTILLAKLRNVLLLSPPEQFDLTLEDLKYVIIGNPSITEEWVENVRKEVRCNPSRTSETFRTSSFSDRLKNSLLSNYYKATNDIVGSCNVSSEDNKLFTIQITRDNHQIRKCLSGSTTAIWKVLRTATNTNEGTTGTSCTLSGTMKVQAHAFENDNNVHMSCSIDWNHSQWMTISADDESSLCTEIANRVECWDSEILQSLKDDLYSTMEDSILKPVRRVLVRLFRIYFLIAIFVPVLYCF